MEAKNIDALFRKTPNKFNRDILKAWAHYSFHTPKTTLEIRNQFIWFNSHIKITGKPTFHNIMHNAGITHVKHLLNQYGNILKYHDFIQKYGIHIHFLNYFSIVSAIPASWKVILLENNYDNQATYMHSFDRIRSTKSKICKLVHVYMNMLTPIVQQPDKVFNKWKNYFNNDLSIDDWLNSFEIIYNCTKFIDLHFFHFKMLHQTLANNEALYKWTLTESDLCSFCNEEIKTIYHTYLECEITKLFWKELKSYIYSKLNVQYTYYNNKSRNYTGMQRGGSGNF